MGEQQSGTGSDPGTGPTGPQTGPIGRLIGVFTAPTKTFESIARKPGWDWLVPVVLAVAVSFTFLTVSFPKLDVDGAVAQQMKVVEKMAQGQLDDQKRAEIEDQTREGIVKGGSLPRRLLASLAILIPLFFVPAVYHGIAAAFGKSKRYMGVVACYAYLLVIPTITGVLSTVIAASQSSLDTNDVQFNRLLKSNPAAFMDFESTNKALLAVLSSLDVFDVILFVLTAAAISQATSFTKKGAMIVVACWWGFYVLLKMGGGALMSAFVG